MDFIPIRKYSLRRFMFLLIRAQLKTQPQQKMSCSLDFSAVVFIMRGSISAISESPSYQAVIHICSMFGETWICDFQRMEPEDASHANEWNVETGSDRLRWPR